MDNKNNDKDNDVSREKEEIASLDSDDIIVDEEEGDPGKVLKKLKERFRVCEADKQEYLNGWQRSRADYINAKKEAERKLAELEPHMKEKILLEILPVADNFDMAFGNKEAWEKLDKNWRIGIEGIYNKLIGIFSSLGLEQVGGAGDKFDPNKHEAVGEILIPEPERDGVVVEIVQKGYVYRDKVIRPVKVKIGRFKEVK